ncbi:MAG: hypothetical protein J6X70_08705 [Muribaculaceae bacterium]|nr:hypothetical protein [Muribaculaceae bacterium]
MERPPFLQNLEYGKLYVFYGKNNEPLNQIMYYDNTQGFNDNFFEMPIVNVERDDILDRKVYIAARRFNVGNMGRDAVTWTCFDVTEPMVDMVTSMLKQHVSHIDDDTSGDDFLDISRLMPMTWERLEQRSLESSAAVPSPSLNEAEEPVADASPVVERKEKTKKRGFFNRLKYQVSRTLCEENDYEQEESENENAEAKLAALEKRRQQDLAALESLILRFVTTYHQDPSKLIGKWIKGKYILNPGEDNLSRLVVNGDLQIVLPDWNEKVLPMHALARTLYILFLRHPEGIVLKDIGDYRQELLEIYNIVKPGRDEALAVRAIDSLTAPFSDTLSQNLSRIKRAVKTAILDDDTARHYYIDGRRGQPYRIDLPQHLVTLPAIFKP